MKYFIVLLFSTILFGEKFDVSSLHDVDMYKLNSDGNIDITLLKLSTDNYKCSVQIDSELTNIHNALDVNNLAKSRIMCSIKF